VREVDEDTANTALRAKNATSSNSSGFLIKNEDHYKENYSTGILKSNYGTGEWVAKYPGIIGNSIKVCVCPSANAYESTLTGTITVAANSATITGTSTLFTTQLTVRDLIVLGDEVHMIKAIGNTTSATLYNRHVAGGSALSNVKRRWEWYTRVDQPPTTSPFAATQSGRDDEIHIIVVDVDGRWTGSNNTLLEVHQNLSLASDAKDETGSSTYYVNRMNDGSNYVWWGGHASTMTSAGQQAKNKAFGRPARPLNYSLVGGKDGQNISNSAKIRGYDMFASPEDIDISIIIGLDAGQTVATHIINNIVEKRRDCVAVFSPPRSYVVQNEGDEADDIKIFRETLPSTSYAILDSNWKLMFDKHNDVNRWVPCNPDVAGMMAWTDYLRDPWWSPAGLTRGKVRNVLNLAWNPREADQDTLYKSNVNPIIDDRAEGPVLYGDKTLLSRPSAFDRINVRRLFIVLEKAIATASRYLLFEFNDAFTRAQFRSMVEPFLRDVQGRRGVTDFKVVCDETNNTPEVIDRNEFVGDIYIKPARSISQIHLRFVAVRTGVQFEEVIGQF
jgi:hypothetical protein